MADLSAERLAEAQDTSELSGDAAAPGEIAPANKCPNCGHQWLSLLQQVEARLVVPATIPELAAHFDMPRKLMSGYLYTLQKWGRAKRLDRTVPAKRKHGKQYDHLWEKV